MCRKIFVGIHREESNKYRVFVVPRVWKNGMHHSHLRLIVAISVLCPRCHGQELNERCKSMALQYWRATSPAVTCCAESREFLPGHFFTVGLEGFGHHAFSGMGISLGVSGGIKSFPFGHKWREDGGMSSYGSPKIEEMMKYKKLLVLVRDLIDAHFSTLRRFWHPKLRPKDTLQVEADAAVRNLRMMRDQVGNVRFSPFHLF